MAEPEFPISGGCMCGAVRFEVSEPLLGALYCHCTRCQRRTGNEASITALTAPGSLTVLSGEELVRGWDPGDGGWTKSFCTECGSQLFANSSRDPKVVSVRMGVFDGDPGVRPLGRQFTADAAVWAPLPDDGLPRFPARFDPAALSSND